MGNHKLSMTGQRSIQLLFWDTLYIPIVQVGIPTYLNELSRYIIRNLISSEMGY